MKRREKIILITHWRGRSEVRGQTRGQFWVHLITHTQIPFPGLFLSRLSWTDPGLHLNLVWTNICSTTWGWDMDMDMDMDPPGSCSQTSHAAPPASEKRVKPETWQSWRRTGRKPQRRPRGQTLVLLWFSASRRNVTSSAAQHFLFMRKKISKNRKIWSPGNKNRKTQRDDNKGDDDVFTSLKKHVQQLLLQRDTETDRCVFSQSLIYSMSMRPCPKPAP